MKIFEKIFSVTDNMCGPNQYMKPSGILDILQSIAGEHAALINIGFDEVTSKNLCYIIARNKYDMIKPIKRFTNIKVVTWPGVAAKIDLDRYYEIYDCETNELLLKGVSKWLLMDITTRRIVRANAINYPTDVCEKVLYDSFDKLRYDDLEFDDMYKYEVKFSDIDLNNHMNNTKYADALIVDLNRIIKHFEINYTNEVKYKDILEIHCKHYDNELKVKGINDNKVSFLAYLTYF